MNQHGKSLEIMYQLTAADFADTGQWKLLVKIGSTGLEAFLENTLHPEIDRQLLCSCSWSQNRDKLRENIEEAVYGNPRLLDDFAARIVIYDPRTLFIPSELAQESPGFEEEVYKEVYPAENTDIMTDTDGDITAAWSLAPGIKSFLMRTFPGARITCNLLDKVRELRRLGNGVRLFLETRQEEADLILLQDDDLVSASTHTWRHPDDLAYLALNLLDVYGYKKEEVTIHFKGFDASTEAWQYILDKCGNLRDENSEIAQ